MINFTHIKTPVFPFRIKYSDTILSLGSCFSVNMAKKMGTLKYNIHQNPSGITFNAASLYSVVKMLQSPNTLHTIDSQQLRGIWSHPDFHSTYNHPNKVQHRQLIEDSLTAASQQAREVSVVLITLGTAYVYRSRATNRIVNNCHKRPSGEFEKELMTIPDIVTALQDIKTTLDALSSKQIHYVLSISPVRHIKNGLVEDRLSKSLLLVAAHQWVQAHSQAHYFPAYEMLTDELRDYRYYADDLIHPSTRAIDTIFNLFESTLLDPKEVDIRSDVQQLVSKENHRALFPESAAHQRFLAQVAEERRALGERYPFLGL